MRWRIDFGQGEGQDDVDPWSQLLNLYLKLIMVVPTVIPKITKKSEFWTFLIIRLVIKNDAYTKFLAPLTLRKASLRSK